MEPPADEHLLKHDQVRPVHAAGGPDVGLTGAARATSIVGMGMMAMNALAYGFTLLAAHLLGPTAFGGVSALLGVIIIANVGALALQATAARRLATCEPSHRSGVRRDIMRSSIAVAGALGILLLLAAPLLNAALHLNDVVAAALVAIACVPLTLMGGYAGIVQGERRWAELALIYLAMGAGRVVGGGTALLISPTLRSAMVGIAIGSFAPAALGAWYSRTPTVASGDVSGHEPVIAELWRNGHTLLAFFAFTNLDVVLARNLFSHHDAGIYAAGAILAKTCLFLPTFVLVAAFPTMASERRERAWVRPLLAVAGLGLLAVAGAWLLPDLAVSFAGGSAYGDLADVAWLFALEGTVFAVIQILVYETIAGQTHSAIVLWLGATVIGVVAVPLIQTVGVLVSLVVVVSFGIALVTGLMPGATNPD
jgi:O-antigen/teichoic acid export membrane protein